MLKTSEHRPVLSLTLGFRINQVWHETALTTVDLSGCSVRVVRQGHSGMVRSQILPRPAEKLSCLASTSCDTDTGRGFHPAGSLQI